MNENNRKKIEKNRKKPVNNKKQTKHTSFKAIILVILCTILTSTGQILWKLSTSKIEGFDIISLITNIPLMLGFISYALGAVLLIFALKEGELSVIYPFIALSFIWVTLTSIFLFHEHVSILNWAGITAILIGVSLIGYGSDKGSEGK